MAEVYPFRGIRYNEEVIEDLAQVICPPYDVITPEERKLYYEKSDYNAIRLEYPLALPDGSCQSTAYGRAAITLEQWLKQGILQFDDCPVFYLHDHRFEYLGRKIERRGLIARVRLEPWGSGIYPHEETFSKAKDDRLQLMRACQANFSPLFSLYSDPQQKIATMLAEASKDKPVIEITDSGERHTVWAMTNSKLQQQIRWSLAGEPVYMADGHHRYETALAYQQERTQVIASKAKRSPTGKEAFNYVMMELVDFCDPGLVVFPIHRLVRGVSLSILAKLREQLENFFICESVPLTRGFVNSLKSSVLGVLGLESGCLVCLKQRQNVSIEAMMPSNRSQAYKEFNVSLLNHVILESMLGLVPGDESIAYSVDATEAYQQIREKKYQLAFLLNPLQPEMVRAVADAKDRMPRKSSYFYPKLPAGLVINYLGEES